MSKIKYYRNTEPINGVEEQALWERKEELFQLVDDDFFATASIKENEAIFIEVETPEALK